MGSTTLQIFVNVFPSGTFCYPADPGLASRLTFVLHTSAGVILLSQMVHQQLKGRCWQAVSPSSLVGCF